MGGPTSRLLPGLDGDARLLIHRSGLLKFLGNFGQCATAAMATTALPATRNLQVANSIDPSSVRIPLSRPAIRLLCCSYRHLGHTSILSPQFPICLIINRLASDWPIRSRFLGNEFLLTGSGSPDPAELNQFSGQQLPAKYLSAGLQARKRSIVSRQLPACFSPGVFLLWRVSP
jgi:hypothetical protein